MKIKLNERNFCETLCKRFLYAPFLLVLLTGFTLTSSLAETENDVNKDIRELKIVVGIFKEEDAEFFNKFLTSDDIVFTYGAKLRLLRKIRVPKILVTVQSIPDMKKALERLKTISIDFINYNPEQWRMSHTPREEINNLLDAVKKTRILARQKNVKLGFGTDHILLDRYGKEVAPLVDLFGIQLQRYQRDSLKEFREEALKKVAIVRKGNKKVPVFIQVSMAPPKWVIRTKPNGEKVKVPVRGKDGRKLLEPVTAEEVVEKIEAIKDLADGVGLLYTEKTREEMKRLIHLLRR